MAEIRCPNCGKDNPDFFDVCQFCQTPLQVESMLHAGDAPSEMDTGELEPILPEWLQDARQQNRDAVEDNSVSPVTQPKIQSSEPIDLLAGLTSQDDSDEDDVPDWLASINPVDDENSQLPSTPTGKEEATDFFSQFSQTEAQPSTPVAEEPAQNDIASFMGGAESQSSDQTDELRDWLSQSNDESSAPLGFEQSEPVAEDNSWMDNLGSSEPLTPDAPEGKVSEDLSWLHNLEAEAKKTGDLSAPKANTGFDIPLSQSEDSQDDLSWLDNLGRTPAPASTIETPPSQPEPAQEDLGWLNNLGGTPVQATEEPAPAQSESSQDDLGWMSNLGEATPATEESAPAQSESSQDDLSWMSNLEKEQSSQTPETPSEQFSPAHTAPLDENAGYDSTPDWLKSAIEEPSMPASGELSMDWFANQDKTTESDAPIEPQETSNFQFDEASASTQSEPAPASLGFDLPSSDFSTTSSQDVDDMFNVDMPDLAPQESGIEIGQPSETTDGLMSGDDDLAPVDLPSWVQDMRPVDSAIAGTNVVNNSDQEAESEGPLAGFLGVIPSAPIGSSLRPKVFSLKLQVTDEQQAGAEIIEQIIAGETSLPSTKPATVVASQRMLRWILSGLFIIALSLVIGFGWQRFDIIAPPKVSQLSDLIMTIPDNSPVLLVIDYEPAVAGEMVVAAGPVLDQLALARHSTFIFLSMSPNGSAMAEHLLSGAKISSPASDNGLEYQIGEQYFNAGFLPGGSAGVLGFITNPVGIMPDVLSLAAVSDFSTFEAIVIMTDNADSGSVWVEQLEISKQTRPEIAFKPLIVVSSAQAGPMLEPYASSGQVDVLINGLSDGAKYEYVNQSRPGTARTYWDSFGIGLMIAVLSIVLGSVWNILMGIRERRAEAEQG